MEVHMKRTISIIFVIMLVISSTLLLVACNKGMNEEQWNAAMDALVNCDVVTISYHQEKSTNARTTKTYDDRTLRYDLTNGKLYAEQTVKRYNMFDVLIDQTSKYQYVEVNDLELIKYIKNIVDNRPTSWSSNKQTCNSNEEAKQRLKQVFESYFIEYGLNDFNYSDFSYKKGKYVKSSVVNENNATWQLTFDKGKFTKANYETKHKWGSSSIDYDKISIVIEYSVDISTPSDLPPIV